MQLKATARAAGLESALARNAMNYDRHPYASHAFAQTDPRRIGAIARLFGLAPHVVGTARILELGCSSGGNIIPLAARYPDADVQGIDISRVQVAAGRERIETLGLTNITLHCQSFTEVSDSIGKFDYVIAHGVYTWLPGPVREAMLALIGRVLADDGVAYVSYNVLPGWRIPQALRDAMLLTVPLDAPTPVRAERAREALRFIADATDADSVYGASVRDWATRLLDLPDDYVAHEFLEDVNDPCTVLDFIKAADVADLAYLGETDIAPMVADNRGDELAAKLRAMTSNSVAGMEQMMDIVSGRTFRQSLLVRNSAAPAIDRDLTPARLDGLHFTTDGTLACTGEDDGDAFAATDASGRTVTAPSVTVRRALRHIAASHPASFDISALEVAAGAEDDAARADIAETVFRMLLAGMLVPHIDAADPVVTLSGRPKASALARADATSGADTITNARHERVAVDPAAQVLLPLLDGRTGKAALKRALVDAAAAGRIRIARDGTELTDVADLDMVAEEMVPKVLEGVRRAGLLVA